MEGWITDLAGYFDGYRFHRGPVHAYIEGTQISELSFHSHGATALDGRGKFMSVPFVDGHTHLIFGGNRFDELALKLQGLSYGDILKQGGGIQSTVRATRQTSSEALLQFVVQRLDAMLHHGVLTVEAKSGYGLSTSHELRLLEILNKADTLHPVDVIPTFGAAHVVPPDVTRSEYISSILEEMLPEVVNNHLATSVDVFCDRGAFTVDETLTIFDRASSFDIPMRVHAEELEYTGIGKLASERYNLLSADHLLLATQQDFQALSHNQTVAMFMPLAPFGLFTDTLPSGYQKTDAVIGLGSDFNPNNWAVSLQSAIRMAVYRYKMTPNQALAAATSGSHLGVTGQYLDPLQEGSPARFVLINAHSPAELASKFGQNLISHVFDNGNLVAHNNHKIA